MKHMIVLLGLICLLAACSPAGDSAEGDLIVLTASGAITETNRGGRDAFADPMFTIRQIDFDAAYEFSYAELSAMPHHDVTASYPSWNGHEVVATGPRLNDVLETVGATGSSVTLQAIDGYTYSFERAAITDDYILALHANGTPLHLGGHGPVWLVMPEGSSPAGPDSDEALVWGVYVITVAE